MADQPKAMHVDLAIGGTDATYTMEITHEVVDVPRARLTSDDVSWWNIPEQERCVCGHEKARHERYPVGTTRTRCHACACLGFHGAGAHMSWLDFTERLLCRRAREVNYLNEWIDRGHTTPRPSKLHLALGKAIDFAQFGTGPRLWDEWLMVASRAWRAWQAAGRPIRAFGKDTYHGPVSIPALEGE